MSILANLVCTTLTSVKASIWIRLINFLNFQAMIVRNVWNLDDLKKFFSAPHAKASPNNCSFHCIVWPETTNQILTKHQMSAIFFVVVLIWKEKAVLFSLQIETTPKFFGVLIWFLVANSIQWKEQMYLNKFICKRIVLNIDWLLRNDCFPLIC